MICKYIGLDFIYLVYDNVNSLRCVNYDHDIIINVQMETLYYFDVFQQVFLPFKAFGLPWRPGLEADKSGLLGFFSCSICSCWIYLLYDNYNTLWWMNDDWTLWFTFKSGVCLPCESVSFFRCVSNDWQRLDLSRSSSRSRSELLRRSLRSISKKMSSLD